MPTPGRFATYDELLEEVVRLREAARLEDALALIEHEGPAYPRQLAFVHLWRVSLAVALGRMSHAIEAFAEAMAAGCRYPEPMLREWPAIAPLHDIVEFERLAHIAALRYDSELAASHPTLIVERPHVVAPPQGLPLLVVLHGNNATAEETAPAWRAALGSGVVLAVAGSAEIALTPGLFVWNDGDRAARDVTGQIEQLVREQRIDPARIVLAGYSMGGLRALQLAYGSALHAVGVIVVAPWLPAREVEALAAAAPVRTFLAVGDRDASGYEGSRLLAERLGALGVPVDLRVTPGHGHELPPGWDELLGEAIDLVLR